MDKLKALEKVDIIIIGESEAEGTVLLDGGSVKLTPFKDACRLKAESGAFGVDGPFILTPYSSELDPTKRVDFLKD